MLTNSFFALRKKVKRSWLPWASATFVSTRLITKLWNNFPRTENIFHIRRFIYCFLLTFHRSNTRIHVILRNAIWKQSKLFLFDLCCRCIQSFISPVNDCMMYKRFILYCYYHLVIQNIFCIFIQTDSDYFLIVKRGQKRPSFGDKIRFQKIRILELLNLDSTLGHLNN